MKKWILVLLMLVTAPCWGDMEAIGVRRLPAAARNRLDANGWKKRVGNELGIWVSVKKQELVGVKNGKMVFEYTCSTAAKGMGSREGSYQTPLGWHVVEKKFGDGLPWGAVLKGRQFTGMVWKRGEVVTEDLVLTRIFWLRGLEPGKNSGPGVDTFDRYIYIHGTPDEHKLGTAASHGCVRVSNDHVIDLYGLVPIGTKVFITPW